MQQITENWILSLLKKYAKIRLVGECHDCKEEVIIDIDKTKDDYTITGGYIWKYKDIEKPFFKCLSCMEINPKLTNYRPTEVFSRVCGYLRPTQSWNKGKREEFKNRLNYRLGG
jgi:ribonucleoside-triphosphate reductase